MMEACVKHLSPAISKTLHRKVNKPHFTQQCAAPLMQLKQMGGTVKLKDRLWLNIFKTRNVGGRKWVMLYIQQSQAGLSLSETILTLGLDF